MQVIGLSVGRNISTLVPYRDVVWVHHHLGLDGKPGILERL